INSLPMPGPSLRASTLPPCISTNRLTMDSPMPSPLCVFSSDRPTWVNISNTLGSMSGGMPMPVSLTLARLTEGNDAESQGATDYRAPVAETGVERAVRVELHHQVLVLEGGGIH